MLAPSTQRKLSRDLTPRDVTAQISTRFQARVRALRNGSTARDAPTDVARESMQRQQIWNSKSVRLPDMLLASKDGSTTAMQAATIETLMNKGGFQPEVAIAIGEAMDQTLAHAQVVTVPMLDARFAAFESKMNDRFAAFDVKLAKMQTHLILWIIGITVGNNYLPQIVSTVTKAISAAWH